MDTATWVMQMINLNMKPEAVITHLEKILRRTTDTWEHDALVHAINLELKEVRNNGKDSNVDI